MTILLHGTKKEYNQLNYSILRNKNLQYQIII